MGDTIVKLYQKQNFVIGEDILKAIKKNNLTLDEALLIIYFCGNNTHPTLDIDEIKNKFGMDELDIMQAFSSITKRALIKIKMVKNRDGKMDEIIDLTPLYESILIDIGENKKKDAKSDIFSIFENEFGRTFSSMEFQMINSWLDKGIDESLIKSALNESVLSENLSLRYIDAILVDWIKKGYKTEKDVEHYFKRKREEKSHTVSGDLFDYNWLDDDE